ncbi:UV DNA damage repair endonuclease UvsE [Oxalobacteraceae bacterium R-40]|uniref:UV DNA damage repair endonuclease UvsE n=1 Tax=Keguizhuia sedimenti TaxID=3064264 RepID=A0ABU1BP20_9BURK|nr:UV DNA damage repair endonuclease UvsE [Oxalobacteraceae bacterium R-40]
MHEVTNMIPQLGLVCITQSNEVRYRTITRKRLLQQTQTEQQALLAELYTSNLNQLHAALRYCKREAISLYRIPSSIFPFSDDDMGRDLLASMAEKMAAIGEWATANAIRLVMHPDQFVVLSSDSDNVVQNSITILQMHADIMDLLKQPRSPWALVEIHGGKAGRSEKLIDVIGSLPDGIRTRLALENDEYAYSAEQIVEVCKAAGVPMVFDAHHHVIKEGLTSFEHPSVAEMLGKARETWADPSHQLTHISNGRTGFNDRAHADFIEVMPSSYRQAPWIEIEAKFKELAIQKVRAAM